MIPKNLPRVSNIRHSQSRAPSLAPVCSARPIMSTQERRRHPRYDVRKLSGVLEGSHVFETLKISAGGALVRLPVEVALEQRVIVSFDIGESSFKSVAVVVFVGPDLGAGASGLFRVGLAFVDTPLDERARLQRFIERSIAAGAIK